MFYTLSKSLVTTSNEYTKRDPLFICKHFDSKCECDIPWAEFFFSNRPFNLSLIQGDQWTHFPQISLLTSLSLSLSTEPSGLHHSTLWVPMWQFFSPQALPFYWHLSFDMKKRTTHGINCSLSHAMINFLLCLWLPNLAG